MKVNGIGIAQLVDKGSGYDIIKPSVHTNVVCSGVIRGQVGPQQPETQFFALKPSYSTLILLLSQ